MEYVISLYVYVCYMLNYMCMGMLGGKGGGTDMVYGSEKLSLFPLLIFSLSQFVLRFQLKYFLFPKNTKFFKRYFHLPVCFKKIFYSP